VQLGSWSWNGHRLVYEDHGEGNRLLVYVPGLLLSAACNRQLAAGLARRGHRVVVPELLGHGRSDAPRHATAYRLEYLADQVLALLDHLEVDEAVVGGVSLGANVTLQLAVTHPQRLRAAVLEMPVLERGGITAVTMFTPLVFLLRGFPLPARAVTAAVRHLPRSRWDAANAFLDAASGDPRAIAAVLHGLQAGPVAPAGDQRRRIEVPTLIVGHPRDLLHPIDDAEALLEELPSSRFLRASSMFEARTRPGRVVTAVADFLDDAWRPREAGAAGRDASAPSTAR
jgi:pimeloyl-ACP methyl ester carboxylesterase